MVCQQSSGPAEAARMSASKPPRPSQRHAQLTCLSRRMQHFVSAHDSHSLLSTSALTVSL